MRNCLNVDNYEPKWKPFPEGSSYNDLFCQFGHKIQIT